MNKQILPLSVVRLDGDTQPREAINQDVVKDYAEAMRGGAVFPPVDVYHDGTAYWLVDGFHRLHAARQAGRTEIAAIVQTGVQAEAQWASLAANKTHGLRRTNADKAKAVSKALRLKPEMSDHAIAQHLGVGHAMVSRYRVSPSAAPSSPVLKRQVDFRTGRDGKTYDVTKILSRKAKRREFRISPKAIMPVHGHSEPRPMRPLSMPCNAVMGARTLFEMFDREYILKLMAELQSLLNPTPASQPTTPKA